MTQWEYLTSLNAEEEFLNHLGLEGWELVTVVVVYSGRMFYFKRPVQQYNPNEPWH